MADSFSMRELGLWLDENPREISIAIASRAALRAVPALFLGKHKDRTRYRNSIVLPVFRALAESWTAAAWPTISSEISKSDAYYNAERATRSIANYQSEIDKIEALISAVSAAAHACATVRSNINIALNAVDAVNDALLAAKQVGTFHSNVALNAMQAAISVDINELKTKDQTGMRSNTLVIQRLWPKEIPDWASEGWSKLKTHLLACNEDWEVWVEWYEARINGGLDGLRKETERKRIAMDDTIWNKGPKWANAHIRELLRSNEPPQPPIDGPGPNFAPTPLGFEIFSTPLKESERENPIQVSLHTQIKRRIERLNASMPGLKNTHKVLCEEYDDFTGFASTDLADLDVASFWSAGIALGDMVDAVARVSERSAGDFMTPPLEPEVLAQLQSLVRDSMAFILGFADGQELASRAAAVRLLNIEPDELARRSHGVLSPMVCEPSLLASRANSLVRAIDRALDTADDKTLALVSAAVGTTTRSVVAFGRAAALVVTTMAVVASASGANISNLAGDPNAETIRTAIKFLLENANAISAFAAHDNRLQAWLDWLISEIRLNIPRDSN
jgi:hypothetical protein